MIAAFFFMLLVPWQSYPIIAGPYETWDECNDSRMWFDQRGWETDDCTTLPLPQDARYLRPLDYP